MRGDVRGHALSPPLSTRGRNANRQFLRNAWYTCAQLRYLVSLYIYAQDRPHRAAFFSFRVFVFRYEEIYDFFLAQKAGVDTERSRRPTLLAGPLIRK